MSSSQLQIMLPLLLTCNIISALSSSSNAQYYFPSYGECDAYPCGNSTISYPLGPCGPLFVECTDDDPSATQISLYLEHFTARLIGHITKSSYSTQTLQISQDLIGNSSITYDRLMKGGFFKLSEGYITGTILNCTQQEADLLKQIMPSGCKGRNNHCFFYPGIQIPSCERHIVIVQANKTYSITADKDLEKHQRTGFEITWSIPDDCRSCQQSGGRCFSYFNDSNYEHYCICPNDDVHYKNFHEGEYLQNLFYCPYCDYPSLSMQLPNLSQLFLFWLCVGSVKLDLSIFQCITSNIQQRLQI